MAELDKDNSGGIDFDEYYKLATLRAGLNETKKEIAKAFNLFDWNREGNWLIEG